MGKFTTILTILALISTLALTTCAFLTPQEQDLVVKITARRFAAHGMQMFPTSFTDLGKTAKEACEKPGETMTPAAALEVIAQAVTLKIGDPLLAADLKDLIALLGIRFDPAFELIGITEQQERQIKVAVCAFAEGVDLYSKQ